MHIIYEKSTSDVQHKKYGLNMWNEIQMLHESVTDIYY